MRRMQLLTKDEWKERLIHIHPEILQGIVETYKQCMYEEKTKKQTVDAILDFLKPYADMKRIQQIFDLLVAVRHR